MDNQHDRSDTLYLVTGVAGNLGSSVAARLLEEGKSVRGLVLNGDPAAARVPKEVEICFGDVTDKDSLARFFAAEGNVERVVIHCAAIVTVNPGFNQKVYDVNVDGTRNILDACLTHGVKKLVYVSSTGAIPELPHGQAITEIEHLDPEAVVGFYGKTKAMATQAVIDAVRTWDLDASIVYPTGICGPDDYAFGPVAGFIMEYCAGKMPCGMEGSFNAVDARDLAEAIVTCCEKGGKGEGYILGNACVTMPQMFRLLSALTGTKEVKMILPAGAARLFGKLSDVSEKITGKPARMTSFAVYNLIRNNVFDCSKAKRELGYHTRPFEDAIADTIDWLVRENKISCAGNAPRQSRTA
ncbi:dihydroflavonol-4-reductase [Sporobacter termitidis DSM 10068]|uniref:Dihydroflavonol-4-reductase n=1 Tax=Sporobacter termitidis DSM 10068 TaxID=1123282 RepID=A0A1M5YNJ6_9FIRM|nr:NAD-dependent epimerase/dehydratase family protein [Sporobacter termitidis]SHI13582.1 dihydroflavonol-4-reductase [Sporobacter termitidis DSM 10068]